MQYRVRIPATTSSEFETLITPAGFGPRWHAQRLGRTTIDEAMRWVGSYPGQRARFSAAASGYLSIGLVVTELKLQVVDPPGAG